MGVVVDSSVLIALERRGLALSLLDPPAEESVAMSAVTVSELLFGLHRAQTPEQTAGRRRFLDAALAAITVLSFDLDVAEVHARIWAELSATGQRIGAHDVMIGATALTHGHAVLTLNLRDFERIPGLEVRQPAW